MKSFQARINRFLITSYNGYMLCFVALVIGGSFHGPPEDQKQVVQLFPSTNDCQIPSLPEQRYDHVSFVRGDGTVVTCGGRTKHKVTCMYLQVIRLPFR